MRKSSFGIDTVIDFQNLSFYILFFICDDDFFKIIFFFDKRSLQPTIGKLTFPKIFIKTQLTYGQVRENVF